MDTGGDPEHLPERILMESIATWPAVDRAELIREASALKPMPAEVMEKDFWVCWVLNRLFRSSDMARKILFKGRWGRWHHGIHMLNTR